MEMNAVPAQSHISCRLVSLKISVATNLGSHLMCVPVPCLAGTIVGPDLPICIIPMMPKTKFTLKYPVI